jgi:hypothetical protein
MAVVINGSGTVTGLAVGGLPDGIVDSGTLATNSVDSAELIDGAVDDSHMAAMAASKLTGALPAIDGASLTGITTGKVLQVVSVEKSDTFSTSSTSFVDITGLSVAITPSATSSKILVLADVGIASGTDGYTQNVRLRRDSTSIAIGDASSNRVQSTGNHAIGHSIYFIHSVGVNVLDTPATTSSVTYKFQLVAEAASTAYVNRPGNNNDNSYAARTASHITLMEIGA